MIFVRVQDFKFNHFRVTLRSQMTILVRVWDLRLSFCVRVKDFKTDQNIAVLLYI